MEGMQGCIRRRPSSKLDFAGIRRFPRKQVHLEVLVQDADGWELPFESLDFSPAGMFVRSNFLFETGAVHNLIFRSPDGEDLFSVRARVVRVENEVDTADDGDERVPGMAYEFLDVESDDQGRLRNLAERV